MPAAMGGEPIVEQNVPAIFGCGARLRSHQRQRRV